MGYLTSFDLIILFFILGVFSSWIKSDLSIPEAVSKFLSVFLLLSLGLKGGHEVRTAQSLEGFFPALSLGLASCFALPFILFFLCKRKLGTANASGIAASYGSVSAITFVTAQGILENEGISSSGFMVAVMALMEIPAILMALYFYQKYSSAPSIRDRSLLKSILSTKSVVLLIGGFIIGLSMNQSSWSGIAPVVQGCFKGFLVFFLLDLGIVAQKQLRQAWNYKVVALPIAILFPLISGTLFFLIGHAMGISKGDQILISILVGSGSYIAAPAAVRVSIPDANPSLFLALPLALTFPMNLLFGISYYMTLSQFLSN